MMMTLFMLALILFELSFVSALPFGLSTTPLVFLVLIYLLQRHNNHSALVWLVFYGFTLDYFHLAVVFPETITYLLAAVVAYFVARHMFSQHSFYGVLACASVSYLTILFVQSLSLLVQWIGDPLYVDWSAYGEFVFWRYVMMVSLLFFVYPIGKRAHLWLKHSFLQLRT
jgi:hypothetical protein